MQPRQSARGVARGVARCAAAFLLSWAAGGAGPWAAAGEKPAPAAKAPAAAPAREPAPAAGKSKALVLDQVARGLPDQKPDEPARQRIIVQADKNRLILIHYAGSAATPNAPTAPIPEAAITRKVILRLDFDPPEIYEVWDRDRTFRKTRGDLNRIQEERDKQEDTILRHLKDYTKVEQEAALRENFLRVDGMRDVDVQYGGTSEIQGYKAQEVTVTENGRPIVRAWLTRDMPGANSSFFHLYRRLGAFSKEVLDKVAGLEGLPLKAEITVVTAGPVFKISAECQAVKTEEVGEDAFLPPSNYQERVELPAISKCASCGKELEPDEAWGKSKVGSQQHLFCSKVCRDKWWKAYTESRPGAVPPDRSKGTSRSPTPGTGTPEAGKK